MSAAPERAVLEPQSVLPPRWKRIVNHEVWGYPLWRTLGVILGIITATASSTGWLVQHLRPPHSDRDAFTNVFGPGVGDAVYDLAQGFPGRKAKLQYNVRLSEQPFPNTKVSEPFKNGDYYFFESILDFKRSLSVPQDEVMVAAITDPNKLSDWIKRPNVIFREVIGFNPSELAWINEQMEKIDQATDILVKFSILQQFFELQFEIDGVQVPVSEIRREPNGYAVVYKEPRKKIGEEIRYQFRLRSIQPRSQTSFPFIISEPTRWVDVRIDLGLTKIKSPSYFSAFVVRKDTDNPKIEFDSNNKVLEIQSLRDEWLLPGNGVVLYWGR